MIVASVVTALTAAAPVSADNFEYGGCSDHLRPCWQTNKNIYVFYDANLPEVWRDAVRAVRRDELNPLPGWQTYYGSHADADVHYLRDDAIGTNVMGEYFCSELGSTGYCDHAHVRFNHGFTTMWETLRKKVACHETGHSVGLHHRDPAVATIATYGCMISGKQMGNYTGDLANHNRWHMQNSAPY